MRAPIVIADGCRPHNPLPCAQLSASGLVTRSGVFLGAPKLWWSIREYD
jgi:hypothetical protein